ncbi:MAG: hypothetical protein JHD17_07945 [Acidimicrobiia bacterium]|nr:hypothetical protein [Acidimicrobiia bacterium]
MLLTLWSPKGGSGTSVTAAACALVLARRSAGARLADLAGDLPAIFGLASDPETGLADWLMAGADAPVDALARLAVVAAPGVALAPWGGSTITETPTHESGAVLAAALLDSTVPTVVDAGSSPSPAARAVLEASNASVLVVRGCYLALRRAVHNPLLDASTGIVLIEEPGRALGATEVADVLGRPVLARIPVRATIARAVDAGVISSRLPDALARPATRLLERIEFLAENSGVEV